MNIIMKTMTDSVTNLNNIESEMLANGVTPKHVVLRPARGSKRSLWGVKSRVSGVNRKACKAMSVGNMDATLVMDGPRGMQPR
jgi:hypothetical protein